MRNIELKVRLNSLEDAVAVCQTIEAQFRGDIHQLDTYFSCPNGRLKLRECDPGDNYLVFYTRPDTPDSKASDYSIHFVDPEIRSLLEQAYGINTIVKKVRSLWLWKNVRIHLDRVDGLGTFIEFEAVLSDKFDDDDGFQKLDVLRKKFGIENDEMLDVSYADLVSGR